MDAIFGNDYFTAMMIDVMSPRELYFYRQTTKYLYDHITLDIISNKIISLIQEELQNIFGEKYDAFIDILDKRKIIIHGPFVAKFIWGQWYQTDIDMLLMADDMGNKDDNIFVDYKDIDSFVTYDPDTIYQELNRWLSFEPDEQVILNEYSDKNKLKLRIDDSPDLNQYFPFVFRSKIKVVDDKLVVEIGNLNAIMNKTELLQLERTDDEYTGYYDDESGGYKELSKLADEYGITCRYTPFTNYINCGYLTPVMVYKGNKFSFLNQCLESTKTDRISSVPIEVINDDKINQLYVDFALQSFTIDCDRFDCPFNALHQHIPVPHFHACIFSKKNDTKMVARLVVLEYQDNYLFSNYKFDIIHNEVIDGESLSNVRFFQFPFCTTGSIIGIDFYRELFNNNFDEGEFKMV